MKKPTSFKEELRKSLIFHALTPCFILAALCVLATFFFGYYNISKNNKATTEYYARQLSEVFTKYHEAAAGEAAAMDMDAFMDDHTYRVSVISEIYRFLNQQRMRGDFYLFNTDLECLYTTQASTELRHIMLEQVKGKRQIIMGESSPYFYFYDDHDMSLGSVSAYMILMPIHENHILKGVCGYVIQMKQFDRLLHDHNSNVALVNSYYRILTSTGTLFTDDRGKLAEPFRTRRELIKEGKKYFNAAVSALDRPEIMVFSFLDCTLWIDLCTGLLIIIFFTGTALAISIHISAVRIAEKKTAIIYELVDALGKVEKGDLNVTLDIASSDEFRFIGSSFNMMIGSIRHLIERHQELARENTLATVQIMESQFNPHFLFNSLESIRFMVPVDPEAVEKMIVSLSRMLRYSIQHDQDFVCLQEELDIVNQYARIMMLRYGDRLSVEIKEGEGTEALIVPRMILQPLLENAIKYGYGEKVDAMQVFVESRIHGESLQIIIRDTGSGIAPDLLEELRINLNSSQNRTGHIGLYNVHRRIFLLYGNGYGLQLESEPGEGTKITVNIPAREKSAGLDQGGDGRDAEGHHC